MKKNSTTYITKQLLGLSAEGKRAAKFNWDAFKKHINMRKGIITREQLIKHFKLENDVSGKITMDNYRNYMRAAGYLETVDRGEYKRLRKIPMNMTVQMTRNVAYLKSPVDNPLLVR